MQCLGTLHLQQSHRAQPEPVVALCKPRNPAHSARHPLPAIQTVRCAAVRQQLRSEQALWSPQIAPEKLECGFDGLLDVNEAPILSGGGGGIFFFWQLGVVKYLQQHYDIRRFQLRGASAGGLVAALTACDVDPEHAVHVAHRLAQEHEIWSRPLGLAGVWGGIVRQWLDELLPANAAEICRGRLKLVVTDVKSLRQAYIDDFASKQELIDACLASAHVPFFLDWRPFATYRDRPYVDGSLQDFIKWENGELLRCGGKAFVLDYSQDELLEFSRMDFLKLRDLASVEQLIAQGYAYAKRRDDEGALKAHFSKFRRDALAMQLPAQGLRP